MAENIGVAANIAVQTQRSFVEIQNPAVTPASAENVALSPAARDALSRLSDLEKNLQTELDAASAMREKMAAEKPSSADPMDEMPGKSGIERATQSLAEHMDISIRVQQQLAQFVMVSSVSSSFGRNLNMFLRGQ